MSTNFKKILYNPDYQALVKSIVWDDLHQFLMECIGVEKHYLYEPYNIFDILNDKLHIRDLFWDKHHIVSEDIVKLLIDELQKRKMLWYEESWFGSDSFKVLPRDDLIAVENCEHIKSMTEKIKADPAFSPLAEGPGLVYAPYMPLFKNEENL